MDVYNNICNPYFAPFKVRSLSGEKKALGMQPSHTLVRTWQAEAGRESVCLRYSSNDRAVHAPWSELFEQDWPLSERKLTLYVHADELL